MKQVIYLIRHSSPFIEIDNYSDYNHANWHDYNRNMILSVLGEQKANGLTKIDELINYNYEFEDLIPNEINEDKHEILIESLKKNLFRFYIIHEHWNSYCRV